MANDANAEKAPKTSWFEGLKAEPCWNNYTYKYKKSRLQNRPWLSSLYQLLSVWLLPYWIRSSNMELISW